MPFNYTDPTGSEWYVASTSFTAYRGSDVYDTAASIRILNTTGGASDQIFLSNQSETTTASSLNATLTGTGMTFNRQAEVISDGAGRYFLRLLDTITNTGAAAQTFSLGLTDNNYEDGDTTTPSSSSGDAAYTTADDWYTTSSSFYPGFCQAHVVSGLGGSPTSVLTPAVDLKTTSYGMSLAAGQSQSVLHYYILGDALADVESLAGSLSNFASYGYAGLSSAQIQQIVNFDVALDVTSSTSKTLLDYQRNLTLTGANAIDGNGNESANVITGNSAANHLYGRGGDDTLIGSGGVDSLYGGSGNDTYMVDSNSETVSETSAADGTDTVISLTSFYLNDTTRQFVENVTLTGTALNATGNALGNYLTGNANQNLLTGLGGNDTLDGGANADTMNGGEGDDSYYISVAADVIQDSSGVDTVYASFGGYTLANGLENLTLVGNAATGSGNGVANKLTAGDRVATMTGGAGDDTYYFKHTGDVAVEVAGGGNDTVVSSAAAYKLGAGVENLTLEEGTAARSGTGNAGANVLTGNSASNTLDGSAGNDTMIGGEGGDTYVVDSALDVVTEQLGQGVDTVRTTLSTYTLGANVENGVLVTGSSMTGNELFNNLQGNRFANTLTGLVGDDTLRGGGGNDVLNGGDDNDLLIGDTGGPERITGSGVADVDGSTVSLTLNAPETGQGAVTLSGTVSSVDLTKPLNVVFVVDQSGSMGSDFEGSVDIGDLNGDGSSNTIMDAAIASFEKLNQSIIDAGLGDVVRLGIAPFDTSSELIYSGAASTDTDGDGLTDAQEALRTLIPTGSTNYTAGLQTALDFVNGQPDGRNIVFFASDGFPNDTDYLTSILPALRAAGAEGTLIRAIGLGEGADEGVLDELDDGVDNDSAQIVRNPDELDASLSESVVTVSEGAFVEIYKNGQLVDIIGNDQFTVTPFGLSFTTGALALSTSGTDTFSAVLNTTDPDGDTITVSLPISVSTFVSNDTLNGGAGSDTLNGGVGSDSMTGGIGDDQYSVDNTGDRVIEALDEGFDTVTTTLASYTLGANVEALRLGVGGVSGTGNSLGNSIEGNAVANTLNGAAGSDTLGGGGGGDRLLGGSGDDYDELYGDAGADTLDGQGGADFMDGGDGSDTYSIENSSDNVFDTGLDFGDVDTVISSVSTSLGADAITGVVDVYVNGVENLTLTGDALLGVGNEVANLIIGNAKANTLYGYDDADTLDGGAGADTMYGGTGDDTYYITSAQDVMIETSGIDTVISSLTSYTLLDGFEKLRLNGPALNGTGNSANNTIVGTSGTNTLDGLAGADTMIGGAGSDTYRVDSVADRVIETANQGTDTVQASTSYSLSANVENLTLTGTGSFSGAGNTLANLLTGNDAGNRLLGGAGADTLNGGLGSDTLIGGTQADKFVFTTALSATNVDTIQDFVVGEDRIQLDDAVFTALTAGSPMLAGEFTTGAAATNTSQHIIYNSTTGALFYDQDGSGGTAAIRFATLGVGLSLTSASFDVI